MKALCSAGPAGVWGRGGGGPDPEAVPSAAGEDDVPVSEPDGLPSLFVHRSAPGRDTGTAGHSAILRSALCSPLLAVCVLCSPLLAMCVCVLCSPLLAVGGWVGACVDVHLNLNFSVNICMVKRFSKRLLLVGKPAMLVSQMSPHPPSWTCSPS